MNTQNSYQKKFLLNAVRNIVTATQKLKIAIVQCNFVNDIK